MAEGIPDVVTRETGRFVNSIYNRIFGRSPLIDNTRRDVYPLGLSQTLNVLTYERTAPYEADPTWQDVTVADGQEGGTCLPPVKEISVGSTTRNFNPKHYAIHGPPFCATDFRSVFELSQQLSRIADVLSDYVRLLWENRDRNEYFRTVQTKVVVNDCYNPTADTTGASSYPASQATYPMMYAVLAKYRIRLLRDGANAAPITTSGGGPILMVFASAETIGNLIRVNTDIRQDIRWAESGNQSAARLLQGYGVTHTFGGFVFIEDLYPRRFTYSNGVYTQVPTFLESAATKGKKADLNPAWIVAPYEETTIFDPSVLTQLVPNAITNPQAMFRFDPVRYTGDWKILNIPHLTDNPDGTIMRHRAVLTSATMPVHPERGVAFVHLRCEPIGCQTTCTS